MASQRSPVPEITGSGQSKRSLIVLVVACPFRCPSFRHTGLYPRSGARAEERSGKRSQRSGGAASAKDDWAQIATALNDIKSHVRHRVEAFEPLAEADTGRPRNARAYVERKASGTTHEQRSVAMSQPACFLYADLCSYC